MSYTLHKLPSHLLDCFPHLVRLASIRRIAEILNVSKNTILLNFFKNTKHYTESDEVQANALTCRYTKNPGNYKDFRVHLNKKRLPKNNNFANQKVDAA